MPLNGVMVVDKPAGWTSHDVVARMRRIVGERSIGHLGTLDPMATGVLPLVLGRMTRLCQFYTASGKTYEGTIRLGVATDTYDCDGDPVGDPQEVNVTLEEIRAAAVAFCGIISQTPPPFSAKKIKGVPAYKLARRKQEVELKPVEVEVKEFAIGRLGRRAGPDSAARCRRGPTYAAWPTNWGRSWAWGPSGQPAPHRRRRVLGRTEPHSWKQSPKPPARVGSTSCWCIRGSILPEIPSVTADDEAVGKIRHGRSVNLPEMSRSRLVKVFAGQSELICIASRVAGTLFHPKVVLLLAQDREAPFRS